VSDRRNAQITSAIFGLRNSPDEFLFNKTNCHDPNWILFQSGGFATVQLGHISVFHHTCQESYYFHPLFNDGFTPLKGNLITQYIHECALSEKSAIYSQLSAISASEILRIGDQKAERFPQNLRKNVLLAMRNSKYLGMESKARVTGLTRGSQRALRYSVPNRGFRLFRHF
jgi:hypothetical protein